MSKQIKNKKVKPIDQLDLFTGKFTRECIIERDKLGIKTFRGLIEDEDLNLIFETLVFEDADKEIKRRKLDKVEKSYNSNKKSLIRLLHQKAKLENDLIVLQNYKKAMINLENDLNIKTDKKTKTKVYNTIEIKQVKLHELKKKITPLREEIASQYYKVKDYHELLALKESEIYKTYHIADKARTVNIIIPKDKNIIQCKPNELITPKDTSIIQYKPNELVIPITKIITDIYIDDEYKKVNGLFLPTH